MKRDLEKLESPVYSVKAHKEIVNAIDGVGGLGIGEGAPELVTASRDGWFDTLDLASHGLNDVVFPPKAR